MGSARGVGKRPNDLGTIGHHIQIPRNHEEAMMINAKNGDTRWKDSEDLELKQLFDYDSFQDLGKGAAIPEGYTKIRCHFVYNCKHDGRFKSRFVAGGNMTDTPVATKFPSERVPEVVTSRIRQSRESI